MRLSLWVDFTRVGPVLPLQEGVISGKFFLPYSDPVIPVRLPVTASFPHLSHRSWAGTRAGHPSTPWKAFPKISRADMEEEEGSCFQSHAAERMFPGAAGGRPHHTWTERVWQENKSNPEQDGLPKWLSGKESTCQAGDTCSISGSGRLPGEGNGSPLQYSCLGNPKDRGAWGLQSTGSQGSQTQLSD